MNGKRKELEAEETYVCWGSVEEREKLTEDEYGVKEPLRKECGGEKKPGLGDNRQDIHADRLASPRSWLGARSLQRGTKGHPYGGNSVKNGKKSKRLLPKRDRRRKWWRKHGSVGEYEKGERAGLGKERKTRQLRTEEEINPVPASRDPSQRKIQKRGSAQYGFSDEKETNTVGISCNQPEGVPGRKI